MGGADPVPILGRHFKRIIPVPQGFGGKRGRGGGDSEGLGGLGEEGGG